MFMIENGEPEWYLKAFEDERLHTLQEGHGKGVELTRKELELVVGCR